LHDTIYFAPTNVSGIMKVSANGGATTEVTRRNQSLGEISHRWPHALPDGKTLLFTVWTGPGDDEKHVVRQTLGTNERHPLVRGGDTPRYVAPGFLLYGRSDQLFAVPWQPAQLDLGGVVPITLPQTPRLENEGNSAYDVSDEGTLIYLAGGESRIAYRVVWVDRAGRTQSLAIPDRDYESAMLSPDDRQALIQIHAATTALWMYDFSRQALTPFATNAGSSQAPVWTVDGKRVI
jgi:serine/threonine-protein kinase